jgi:hypothetical protein
MKKELKIKDENALNIFDRGDHSTVFGVLPADALKLPKKSVDNYVKQARHLLDGLSNEYDLMGIEAVIAALMVESIGNGNYGKMNN